MKTITFLWSRLHIGCLLILTIIASCSDETEESPNVQIELTTINLTASDTEEATVTFTVNTSWTLTTSDTRAIPAWFTIDRTSGNAGTYTLAIKITEENTSDTDNRIGYIHIIAGTAKSTITIIQPPRNIIEVESISIDRAELKLGIGKTETLNVTVIPENATDKSLVWKSDNPKVATVNDTGKVEGVSNGQTTVTVTTRNGEKSAQCLVVVGNPENMFDNEDKPDIDGSSEEKAYEIATAEQLLLLSNRVNGKESDKWNNKYYKLTNDIDMSSVCGEEKGSWMPIGRGSSNITVTQFTGNFNGCGKSIKSLYYNINKAKYPTQGGLFGIIDEDAIIKNIVMESPQIYGNLYCGAIAGVAGHSMYNRDSMPIISGCTVNGGVIKCNVAAGGIVGSNEGIIIDCNVSECEIVSSERESGGIVGSLSYRWDIPSLVKNCKVANSKISSVSSAGGIAGSYYNSKIYASTVTNCEIAGLKIIGGIAGGNIGGILDYYIAGCYVDNTILTATDMEQGTFGESKGVGGIIGTFRTIYLSYKIYSCYVANSVIVSPVSYNAGYIAGKYGRDVPNTEGIKGLSIDACYYSNMDGRNTVSKAIGSNYNMLANTYEIEGNQWGDAEKGAIKEMNDKLDKLSNEGHDIGYRYAIGKDNNVPILIKSEK